MSCFRFLLYFFCSKLLGFYKLWLDLGLVNISHRLNTVFRQTSFCLIVHNKIFEPSLGSGNSLQCCLLSQLCVWDDIRQYLLRTPKILYVFLKLAIFIKIRQYWIFGLRITRGNFFLNFRLLHFLTKILRAIISKKTFQSRAHLRLIDWRLFSR